MYRLKAWIRNFFGFSRSETNGFLILLPLLIVTIFSEPLYRAWSASRVVDHSADIKMLDSLVANWEWNKKDSATDKVIHFFRFNPNTASAADFDSLGLTKRIAERIVNYRLKGGKFKTKSDLGKIYGMDSIWFANALTYIDLPEKLEERKKELLALKLAAPKAEAERFDLNKADTTQLIKIYGIGSKLALRITKYRDKLGGFVVMNQLNEVYGLDSLVIENLQKRSFIEKDFRPAILNLNESTEQELAAHPYLNRQIARSIATYRFQHGPFKSIDDLTKIKLLTEQVIQKMKPYFTL
jgi:competence protein ComEA